MCRATAALIAAVSIPVCPPLMMVKRDILVMVGTQMLFRNMGIDVLIVRNRAVHMVKLPTSVFLNLKTSFLLCKFQAMTIGKILL